MRIADDDERRRSVRSQLGSEGKGK